MKRQQSSIRDSLQLPYASNGQRWKNPRPDDDDDDDDDDVDDDDGDGDDDDDDDRSEEHTSELQSRQYLVCRLLLEKKKTKIKKKKTKIIKKKKQRKSTT